MPTSVTLFCLSGFSHVHHFLRPSLPPPSRLLPVSFPPLPAFLPVFFPLPSRVFPQPERVASILSAVMVVVSSQRKFVRMTEAAVDALLDIAMGDAEAEAWVRGNRP